MIDLATYPPTEVIAEMSRRIRTTCASHPSVRQVYVFGSYARGDFDVLSDVDIWAHYDQQPSLAEYLALADELEAALGKRIDYVTRTDPAALGALFSEMERDKVLLYDRSAQ